MSNVTGLIRFTVRPACAPACPMHSRPPRQQKVDFRGSWAAADEATKVTSRREFLSHVAGGGLLLCFGAPVGAGRQAPASIGELPSINGWVRIDTTGTVELLSNTSEIGQGTGT